jgi:hypothetical protein
MENPGPHWSTTPVFQPGEEPDSTIESHLLPPINFAPLVKFNLEFSISIIAFVPTIGKVTIIMDY